MDKKCFIGPRGNKTVDANKYPAGFTLVEVLISCVILAMATTGLVYVFFAVRVQSVHARSRIQAAEFGKYVLATLQKEVRSDQWGINCLEGGTCSSDAVAPANLTIGGVNYLANYSVSTGVSGAFLQKVKLRINWTEPSS